MEVLKVYESKYFIIFGDSGRGNKPSFILYNKRKDYKDGHARLYSYDTALWIMRLYISKKLPYTLNSLYLLESLARISDDPIYTDRIRHLIQLKSDRPNEFSIKLQSGDKKKSRRRKRTNYRFENGGVKHGKY